MLAVELPFMPSIVGLALTYKEIKHTLIRKSMNLSKIKLCVQRWISCKVIESCAMSYLRDLYECTTNVDWKCKANSIATTILILKRNNKTWFSEELI